MLSEIAKNLKEQDNLATANPIFIVQQRRREYGIESGYEDGVIWVNEDSDQVDEEDKDDKCHQVGYRDRWEFVTACFTRKGCEDYIKLNGHNLSEPRIYVESGYRNAEWEFLRKFLVAPSPETVRGILIKWLEANGYDGLWNGEDVNEPCGCGLDDFEPCGEMSPNCVAAYRHGGLFFPTKPEAGQ